MKKIHIQATNENICCLEEFLSDMDNLQNYALENNCFEMNCIINELITNVETHLDCLEKGAANKATIIKILDTYDRCRQEVTK
jgi:hypothetical protein